MLPWHRERQTVGLYLMGHCSTQKVWLAVKDSKWKSHSYSKVGFQVIWRQVLIVSHLNVLGGRGNTNFSVVHLNNADLHTLRNLCYLGLMNSVSALDEFLIRSMYQYSEVYANCLCYSRIGKSLLFWFISNIMVWVDRAEYFAIKCQHLLVSGFILKIRLKAAILNLT